MRTAGEGQKKDISSRPGLAMEQWNEIQQKIKTQPPATCVFQEPDLIERSVRDFLTEDVERVVVDNKAGLRPDAGDHLAHFHAGRQSTVDKIKLYTEHQPIFDRFNITRQLENAFSRQVHLKSGGYLVIDETEALVAIDVNTGRHKGSARPGIHHPARQPGGGGRNLPPVAPAQHGRADRAGFY